MMATPYDVELAAFNRLRDTGKFARVYIGAIENLTEIPAACVHAMRLSFERTDEKYGRYNIDLAVDIITGGTIPPEEKRSKIWDLAHQVITTMMKHPTLGSTITSGPALTMRVHGAEVRGVEPRGSATLFCRVIFKVTVDLVDIEVVT